MAAVTWEHHQAVELHELRLKLAAAERALEQAQRDWEVNYWKTNAEGKLRAARERVARLGNRLAELEGQKALRL